MRWQQKEQRGAEEKVSFKPFCLRLLGPGADEAALQAEITALKLSSLPPDLAEDLPALTKRTPLPSGKMQLAAAMQRRNWWVGARQHFPLLAQVAVRVLGMHATTCAAERNWSLWGRTYAKGRSALLVDTAEKVIFIKGNEDTSMRGVDEEVQLSWEGV